MRACANRKVWRLRAVALAPLALCISTSRAAAAASPSIDVLGSYFPAWLLCILLGVVFTLVSRLLFIAWKLDKYLLAPPVVYSCLTVIFALTVWLVLFRN